MWITWNGNGAFRSRMKTAEDPWWLSLCLTISQEMTRPLCKNTIYQVCILGDVEKEFVCFHCNHNNLDSLHGKKIPLRLQVGKQRSQNSWRGKCSMTLLGWLLECTWENETWISKQDRNSTSACNKPWAQRRLLGEPRKNFSIKISFFSSSEQVSVKLVTISEVFRMKLIHLAFEKKLSLALFIPQSATSLPLEHYMQTLRKQILSY